MSAYNINVEFCRKLLTTIMIDVRKRVDPKLIKEAWVYNYGNGRYEFQIPSVGMYWYGQADNAYDAKYKGWHSYLEKLDQDWLKV